MRRGLACALTISLACGGGESGDAAATADASGSSSSSATPTSASTSETGATTSSTTGDGDSDTSSADASTSDTGGTEPGPILIFDGPPGDAVIPNWDSADPRPLIAAQFGFGDAWTGATMTIHADGTVTSNAERIVIWEFEPLSPLYDGAHFGGSLPEWDPVLPAPLVALGTGPALGDDWITMTPGLWVDTNAVFVAPGSTVDRIVAWSFADAVAPPSETYNGPWDGTLAFPDWDPEAPSPMVAWSDTAVAGQWRQTPVAVFSDGSTEGFATGGLLVYSWL